MVTPLGEKKDFSKETITTRGKKLNFCGERLAVFAINAALNLPAKKKKLI